MVTEVKEKFVSVGEAAKRLGYCVESVRRLIKAGRLPAVTLPSGQYRIKERDLETILQPVER